MVALLLFFAIGMSFAQNEKKDSLDCKIEQAQAVEKTTSTKVENAKKDSPLISKKSKAKSARHRSDKKELENGFLFKRYAIKNI